MKRPVKKLKEYAFPTWRGSGRITVRAYTANEARKKFGSYPFYEVKTGIIHRGIGKRR